MSAQTILTPIADSSRLEKVGISALTGAAAKSTDLTGPIAAEWPAQISNGALLTPAVTEGGRTYVAIIHEHRLECREGEKGIWSFTAGGRISQPPLLHDGLCYFGSHDGWVYCLSASDGELQWRFLAAPSERNIVSHDQVESSWPVYNVVLHEQKLCCTAGLHPEAGGGIFAWGLDPKTGAIAWQKVFKRSEITGKTGLKIAPNRVMNSPLQTNGKTLSIVGLDFAPTDTDADIHQRIDTGSLGDKNRNLGWTIRGTEVKGR